ncbi:MULTISPECIES: hypothetical protein [unclassified Streptomyces]|uniref:hypothetical protein n=1 Tax=unclassified Streptomyces TaxID=2593676 RepID=UPI0011A03775|nr:hypothetical protein [Streptomyces sp. BK340]
MHDFIRREESRFFRSGSFDSREVASQIALEVLMIGAPDVRITQQADWIAVSSGSDWHVGLGGDVFDRFAPIPGSGRNAVTSEVLLAVFSPAVVTAVNGEVTVIKGESLGPLAEHVPNRGRVVAFQVPTEQ